MSNVLSHSAPNARQMRLHGLALLLIAIVLGISLVSWLVISTPGLRPLIQSNPSESAGIPQPRTGLIATNDNRGQVLFGHYCDSCHPGGNAGNGSTLRNAQFKNQYKTEADVIKYVRDGGFDMPAIHPDFLPDAQLMDIAKYVLSLPEANP